MLERIKLKVETPGAGGDDTAWDGFDRPSSDPRYGVGHHRLARPPHSALTALFYSRWSANAAWFLGAGLGLTLLAVLNWAALDENSRGRVLVVTRSANWVFALFTLALAWAVPQPQAFVIATGVLVQAAVGPSDAEAVTPGESR